MFPFLFRIIKHISSFPNSLRFYSCFSPENIISNFLQIYALIVIDSNIDVGDIAEDLENILAEICIQFLFYDICRFNSLILYIRSCFLF